MIKVSIIITCYNYGKFVADAINSALNQTYDNIEVVVVNDGSTDNSHEVISNFKDNIKYINQTNAGAAIARNNGIKAATGDFILCLDADDWISEYFVEHSVNLIEDSYTIVSPIANFVDSNLNDLHQQWPEYYIINTNTNKLNDIMFVNRINACSLFSKALWETSSGYDSNAPRGEDWIFWISLVKLGAKTKYLISNDIVYYKYRKHGVSRINIVSDEIVLKYILQKYFGINTRQDIIKKLYEVILNRIADQVGLANYNKSELSILQIRDDMFNSEEYKKGKNLNNYIKSFGDFSYDIKNIIVNPHYDMTYLPRHYLQVGKFTSISYNCHVLLSHGPHYYNTASNYPFSVIEHFMNNSDSTKRIGYKAGNVIIGNDVWIGRNVTILPGITIGDGAVIAAGSLVDKDIPPYTIYGGNPIKFIKNRFSEDIILELLELKWWNLPIEKLKIVVPYLQLEMNQDNLKLLKEVVYG